MYESYADVLESYIIDDIAEEGFKEFAKGFSSGIAAGLKESAALIGISAAVLAGFSVKGIYKKLKDRKAKRKADISSSITSSSKKIVNDYLENTRDVLERMKQECPEVIEKELTLRKTDLNTLRSFVLTISKNFKNGGFEFTTKDIDDVLSGSDDKWCNFLENILPEKSPKQYKNDKYGWCDTVTVVDCNIYDWNDIEKNGSINVRNWDETEEYNKTLCDICAVFNGACTKLKCAAKSDYDGDWDDGPIAVYLKPSDEFLKIAKSYGWHE